MKAQVPSPSKTPPSSLLGECPPLHCPPFLFVMEYLLSLCRRVVYRVLLELDKKEGFVRQISERDSVRAFYCFILSFKGDFFVSGFCIGDFFCVGLCNMVFWVMILVFEDVMAGMYC